MPGQGSGATPGSCSSAGPFLQLLRALGPEDQLELGRIAETHPVSRPILLSRLMMLCKGVAGKRVCSVCADDPARCFMRRAGSCWALRRPPSLRL